MLNLTPRIVAYLASEEGIVQEAYKDTKGVWTWALGVAETGGFNVRQYKDRPATLEACLRASVDYMRDHYLPAVARAFPGQHLSEAQIAAALSFNWNTGAIGRAMWVKEYNAGKTDQARDDVMQWTDHGKNVARARRTQALFFGGTFPAVMRATLWRVSKPSYRPVGGKPVDVLPILEQIMGAK